MRGLNTNELETNNIATIYNMQKLFQLKDLHNLEVSNSCTVQQC